MNLIDATLSLLDDKKLAKEQVQLFLQLSEEIGVTHLQISPSIYELLQGKLPSSSIFYMEIGSLEERKKYPGIAHFLMKKTIAEKVITMLQLNDLREIMQLRNYSEAKEIMLIGMDDFLCYEYQNAFKDIKTILKNSEISVYPENSFDLAGATLLCYAKAGGKRFVTSFTGLGNKAATEQAIMGLRLFQHYKVNQNLTSLSKMKTLMEDITGKSIPDKTPILGERIFWVESGIHVDGIMKNPSNYELYPPELVGQNRTIIMGKHSGMNSIKIKMNELGLEDVTEESRKQILALVKTESIQKNRSLTDEEFTSVVRMFA